MPNPAHVLIIWDDDIVSRELALQLEGLGYVVADSLTSGVDALGKISTLKPDAILMNITLAEGRNNLEVTRKIQRKANIPLIYLIAPAEHEHVTRALEISPLACLYKPFQERELELTIELALLQHRADSQARASRHDLERRIVERTAELTASNQVKKHLLDELTESNQMMRHLLSELEKNQAALLRFRSALDFSADGIFLIDRASMRFIDFNLAASERLGFSKEELLGMGPHDIKPYFNRQMLEQCFDEIIASPTHFGVIETVHRSRLGELFPVEVRLGVLESEGRTFMVAVARDITVQRRNAEALRQSEEQSRQITENLQHVLWIGDVATEQLLYISLAFENIWGRSREQVYKRPRMLLADIHPEDRDRITTAMQAVWRDEHAMDEEYRLLKDDGVRWLWTRTFPIRDDKGRVYRIGAITEDITARKENEEKLRFSEEKFRQLFEGAPIGLGVIDQDRYLIDANPALCDMLGYSKEELLTKTTTDIIHPDDINNSNTGSEKLFRGSLSHYVTERQFLTRNGHALWGKLHAAVITDRNKHPMFSLGLIENIDQAKHAESIRVAREEAQKNALVREVHHRIKNHLQGVVGLLRRHRLDDSPCNAILEETIAQISTVATVHGLQGKTLGEEIDLLEMMTAISHSVNDLIPADFATRINSTLDARIALSRDESVPIALALNELLVNARKFSSGTVEIEISGSREKVSLRITNPTLDLPQQKRASGLELVKALLQAEGASFAFEHGTGRFSAEVCLMPPVLKA